MCLAIPGKILSIEDTPENIFRTGKVAFGLIKKDINLSMVPQAKVDDYVLVHVGVALNIVNEKEAKETFETLRKMGELDELEEG